MTHRAGVVLVWSMLTAPSALFAQRPQVAFPAAALSQETRGSRAFLVEAAGATAGSLVGFGAIYLTRDGCDAEDLSCYLNKAGLGLALSAVGAGLGSWFAGKSADTNPSALGGALGAMVGAVAAVGTWHLVNEDLSISNSRAVGLITYSVTQGIVTAIGSRIGSALR